MKSDTLTHAEWEEYYTEGIVFDTPAERWWGLPPSAWGLVFVGSVTLLFWWGVIALCRYLIEH